MFWAAKHKTACTVWGALQIRQTPVRHFAAAQKSFLPLGLGNANHFCQFLYRLLFYIVDGAKRL
jgi:hypothetical protein